MKLAKLDRQELLTWLGTRDIKGTRTIDRVEFEVAISEVAVIWLDDDTSENPTFVLRDDAELAEFLAFVSTYVSTFVPFTSFFRALTVEHFRMLMQSEDLRNIRLRTGLVGAVVSDVAREKRIVTLDELRVVDCISSDACYYSKLILSSLDVGIDRAASRWAFLADTFDAGNKRQNESLETQGRRLQFWEVVRRASGGSGGRFGGSQIDALLGVCRAFVTTPSSAIGLWDKVEQLAPEIAGMRSEMSESRERRARCFSRALQSDSLMNLELVGDFTIGYLGSLLGGGSFEYAGLIGSASEIFPSAALWFGLISGLQDDSDVLAVARSLGRHIDSEFGQPGKVFSPPLADVSFDEFRILSKGRGSFHKSRTRLTDFLTVEVVPTVTSLFRVPDSVEGRSVAASGLSREGLSEARRLTQRLAKVLNDIPKEEDLFRGPPEPKKRIYRRS